MKKTELINKLRSIHKDLPGAFIKEQFPQKYIDSIIGIVIADDCFAMTKGKITVMGKPILNFCTKTVDRLRCDICSERKMKGIYFATKLCQR